MHKRLDATAGNAGAPLATGTPAAPPWRHALTLMLLVMTLPVFLAAAVVALSVLPVVVALAGFDQVRQFVRLPPKPIPIRIR